MNELSQLALLQVARAGIQTNSMIHRSQVIVLPIQRLSLMFTDADIRPKNFYLGPVKPKVSFNE